MEKSGVKFPQTCGFDPAHLGTFFKRLYPSKTAAHVADAIGASERTVENWLDGSSQPSLRWFFRMLAVFGPGPLVACFPADRVPAWLDFAARHERRAAALADIHRLQSLLDAESTAP